MKKILSIMLSVAMVLSFTQIYVAEAAVKTLYISSNGSDSNSGDNVNAPLKKLYISVIKNK